MRRYVLALATFVLGLVACTSRDRAALPAPDAAPASPASPASSAVALEPVPSAGIRVAKADASAVLSVETWIWKTYRGDHFSIRLPGEPKLTALPAEDDKLGFNEAVVEVPGGQVSFAAGYTDHSKEDVAKPEAFLDERVNTPRRGLTDVLHVRTLALAGGFPGRALILRRNISGTPLRVYSRLYLVGLRLYSLIVSTLDVGGVSEDVVKKFMESFKLL